MFHHFFDWDAQLDLTHEPDPLALQILARAGYPIRCYRESELPLFPYSRYNEVTIWPPKVNINTRDTFELLN